MKRPVHFDLESMRSKFQADFAAMQGEALSKAPNERSRQFVEAQGKFHPSITEFCVATAEAQMSCEDGVMAMRAASISIGQMIGSTVVNFGGDPVIISAVLREAMDVASSLISGQTTAHMTTHTSTRHGTVGGNA